MLGSWRSHAAYQSFLIETLYPFWHSDPQRVKQYADLIAKLYVLDLGKFLKIIFSRFSFTGRPSNQQPEIFRSFVAMLELGETRINNWHKRLSSDDVLCAVIGVLPENVPALGTHYHFITRWLKNPEVELIHTPLKKTDNDTRLHIVKKYVERALQGLPFEPQPEILLQEIFAKVNR